MRDRRRGAARATGAVGGARGVLRPRVAATFDRSGVTNVCCESSARDASTLGYRVVMVADANAALHVVYRTFGDVRSTDEVVALLEATS